MQQNFNLSWQATVAIFALVIFGIASGILFSEWTVATIGKALS
jgi:hypothetical protein